MLTGSRGETIAGPGAAWRALPALPPGTATLAAGPAGGFDALAVHRTKITVWQLAPGSAAWARAQVITSPSSSAPQAKVASPGGQLGAATAAKGRPDREGGKQARMRSGLRPDGLAPRVKVRPAGEDAG